MHANGPPPGREVKAMWIMRIDRQTVHSFGKLQWNPRFSTIDRLRSFAWLGRNRRFSKDCEYAVQTPEAMIDIATIRIMLNRLAPA
jgi:transposase